MLVTCVFFCGRVSEIRMYCCLPDLPRQGDSEVVDCLALPHLQTTDIGELSRLFSIPLPLNNQRMEYVSTVQQTQLSKQPTPCPYLDCLTSLEHLSADISLPTRKYAQKGHKVAHRNKQSYVLFVIALLQ
jgi:hypothetical protein